jgi:S-adenosylmethionine/arginine decarboxylase-like enzyme
MLFLKIIEMNKEEKLVEPPDEYWGLATAIDLHSCNPKTIRSSKKIKQFVKELIKLIDMKAFGKCQVVNFGEDERVAGYSMTQLIETSLISGHFANQSNNAYIDVFSCKGYNPLIVGEFAKKFFGANDYTMKTIERR